jgi:hypothetical protein
MAIDPYEPELAKRQKAFQIASKQLMDLMNMGVSLGLQGKPEFVGKFDSTLEALRDYSNPIWFVKKNRIDAFWGNRTPLAEKTARREL